MGSDSKDATFLPLIVEKKLRIDLGYRSIQNLGSPGPSG